MLQQPISQVRLTNVAVVRMRRNGIRFEVAAYKNKVMGWRNGCETDIDEVLQISSVFTNVSKGHLAAKEDLEKCFGTADHITVCKEILNKGELQVSDKERQQQYDNLFRDVTTIVSEKCVYSKTKKPLPVGVVERALKDIHFTVKLNQSAKQQALDAIRALEQTMPIVRAQMRLRLSAPSKSAGKVKEQLATYEARIENEETAAQLVLTILIDPNHFRDLSVWMEEQVKKATLEILDPCVIAEGQVNLDLPEERKESSSTLSSSLSSSSSSSSSSTPAVLAPSSSMSASEVSRRAVVARPAAPTEGKKWSCNTCSGSSFDSAEEHRSHFRSDWHRFNLKRKQKSLETITLAMFEDMTVDDRETFLNDVL